MLGKYNFLTNTCTKIFIEGFGNIAFGNYAIFCVWRIINGSGDLGIFGGVFQAGKYGSEGRWNIRIFRSQYLGYEVFKEKP